MNFRKLLTLITFLAIAAMATRVSIASDTFWHLRAGEWIIQHGQILREDPFSLTRFGESWVYPGWLAQVILFLSFKSLGYPGLNLLTTAFVLVGCLFVWKSLEGGLFARMGVMLLAATTSAVYWSARPHIMTFALTGLFIWVLENYRHGRRNLLWTLPVSMALWGNLHGGFASGFILLLCYLLGELIEALTQVLRGQVDLGTSIKFHRQTIIGYAGIGLISAMALSVNPYGPRMLLYPFMTVGIEVLRSYIQEWQSPSFHDPQVYPFLFSLVLLLFAYAASKLKVSAHEFVISVVFVVLALSAARNIALYALAVAPVLSRHLSSGLQLVGERLKSEENLRPGFARALNGTIFAICAIAAGIKISIPLRSSVNRDALMDQYPHEAIEFIQMTQPKGPLFNSYNWGSYILWELYPDYRSFVDGRTDLFNDEVLEAYLAAWRGAPEWKDVFKRWEIKLVFIEADAPLRYQLELSNWEILYEDDKAVVMAP